MTRLTPQEIGSIFSRLEAVVTTQLAGHEKIGTISLSSSWLDHPIPLVEACGYITLAFSYVTDNYKQEYTNYIRMIMAYLQRFLDDEALVESLNAIKNKKNCETACTDEEERVYQDFKVRVNRRVDSVEENLRKLNGILLCSGNRDPLLVHKIANLYNVEYVAPSPTLWGITKSVLFGRLAR
jgi:hypothetical protein